MVERDNNKYKQRNATWKKVEVKIKTKNDNSDNELLFLNY